MLDAIIGAVSSGIDQVNSGIEQVQNFVTGGQNPAEDGAVQDGAEESEGDEAMEALEERSDEEDAAEVAASVEDSAPVVSKEQFAKRGDRMMAALSRLGVDTLPEVALDEDPDNAEAAHAVERLLEKLGGLQRLLGDATGAVDGVAALCEADRHTAADAQALWKDMGEQGMKPRALTALLSRVAKKGSMAGRAMGKDRDVGAIQDGHAAAGLFLALMRIPGSRTHLFSALPFHTIVMALLPSSDAAQTKRGKGRAPPKRKPAAAPAGARKSKRAGAAANLNESNDEASEDEDMSEEDDAEAGPSQRPASGEGGAGKDARKRALKQAVLLALVFSFDGKDEAHNDLAQVAVEAAMLEDPGEEQDAALATARNLMLPHHGAGANAALRVLKQLIPILLRSAPPAGAPRVAVALASGALEAPVDDEHCGTICASTVVLIQNLAARVPDKAPVRSVATFVCRGLVEALATKGDMAGCLELSRLARFLPRLAQHERVALRVFACELCAELVPLWEAVGKDAPARTVPKELLPAMVRLLLRRASDKFPAVRAKALAALAAALRSPAVARAWVAAQGLDAGVAPSTNVSNQSLNSADLNMSGLSEAARRQSNGSASSPAPAAAIDASNDETSLDCSGGSASKLALANERSLLPHPDDAVSACPLSASSLRRRVSDPKSAVRKAAVALLEARIDLHFSLPAEFPQVDAEADLAALATRCRDASTLVRKQALDSVSGLVAANAGEEAIKAWSAMCFPLVRDTEPSVAERAIDAVATLLLDPIANKKHSMGGEESARMLRMIKDESLLHLQWTCKALARRKPSGLPQGLMKNLVAMLEVASEAGQPLGAAEWTILEESAAGQVSGVHAPALTAAYDRGVLEGWDEQAGAAMRALRRLAPHLSASDAESLEHKLVTALARGRAPVKLAGDMVRTAAAVGAARKGGAGWQEEVLKASHEKVAPLVKRRLEEGPLAAPFAPMREVVCAVFVIGELSLQGVKVPTKVANTLQALLTPTETRAAGSAAVGKTSGGEEELQGHVVLALGKLAVLDSALAAKVVPLFLRELERSPSAVRRNNILLALSDLCVRHTSLVDPHVPRLALCLRDANETVRRHALLVITTLLCSDYVKWRGALFFRYLAATVDDAPSIRDQARQNLFRVLLPKSNHQICHANVVEALFVLNDQTHNAYNNFRASPEERARFSLAGPGEAAKRVEVLRLMASHCSDEQRVSVTGKISEDVLGAAADGTLKLSDAADVVADALALLASKEMRLSAVQKQKAPEEDDMPEDAGAVLGVAAGKGLAAAARSKILGQVVKTNLMRNLIPTLAALKHVLEQAHSPLLGALMHTLATIAKEYKAEMDDVLLSNKQLAAELAFDLRRVDPTSDTTPARSNENHPGRKSTGGHSIGSLGSARKVLLSPSADMRARGKAPTPISIPRLSLGDTPEARANGSARRPSGRNSLSSRNEEDNEIAAPNFGGGMGPPANKPPAALGAGGRESRALRKRN